MVQSHHLHEGYRAFRSGRLTEEADRYRLLAEGQAPRVMVIACADSRVDPATIFAAGPGELFVVRNVAAIVPPHEENGGYHGTSAAIEFAITALKVETVLVMGHGQCGGIAAALSAADARPVGRFIAPWVSLLDDCRDELVSTQPDLGSEDRQRAMEHVAVKQSLRNLLTFPFVANAVQAGTLKLEGAWFSIGEAQLHWLNQETGAFEPVQE